MNDELRMMILSFRVVELKIVLGLLSEKKQGLKRDLQKRLLDSLSISATPDIAAKIKELYLKNISSKNVVPASKTNSSSALSGLSTSVNSVQPASVPFQNSASTGHMQNLPAQCQNLQVPVVSASFWNDCVPVCGSRKNVHASMTTASQNPKVPVYGSYQTVRIPLIETAHNFQAPLSASYANGQGSVFSSSQRPMNNSRVSVSVPAKSPLGPSRALNNKESIISMNPNKAVCTNLGIKLKPLPFYDILGVIKPQTILKPKDLELFQINSVSYQLKREHVQQIVSAKHDNEYKVQLQLRFSVVKYGVQEDDILPPKLLVYNQDLHKIPLPEMSVKKTKHVKHHEIDITKFINLSEDSANLYIHWQQNDPNIHSISLHLVRRLNSETLLQRLQACGIQKFTVTWNLIEAQLKPIDNSEIEAMDLIGSLLCPIGKTKMTSPCRSSKCRHFQCFEADTYIQMNEKKETWVCPICDQLLSFEDLIIDGLFLEILHTESPSCTEVHFNRNHTWTAVGKKNLTSAKEDVKPVMLQNRNSIEIVDIDNDLRYQTCLIS